MFHPSMVCQTRPDQFKTYGGSFVIHLMSSQSKSKLDPIPILPVNNNNEAVVEFSKTDTDNVIIQNPLLLDTTKSLNTQEINFKNWLIALLTTPKDLASDEQTANATKV